MTMIDRLLTILITATITSALWIVAGGSVIELADGASQQERTRPADAAPSPVPTLSGTDIDDADAEARDGPGGLNDQTVSAPTGAGDTRLAVPVLNVRPSDLTDTFSDTREGGLRLHEAIDIMAPRGTSVMAAAPGTIEKLYASKAGGRTVYVRSPDGETIYYYAHLQEYADGLKEGQRVRRGQRIGSVGSSGNASEAAPHLHFAMLQTTRDAEWWEPANAVNPYPLLTAR